MTTPPPASPPVASGTRLLRLAVLGVIEGNAHPYSWSAITNGYDSAVHGVMLVRLTDTYTAFRRQLRSFLDF